ncbi:OC116 protein, partial [Penelope pileata]|nr:OC116 protein [Penelope pileata]
ALLCLCLLGTALPTPVRMWWQSSYGEEEIIFFIFPQILLKGCNSKHGFYVFKYTYSIVARRNQTQIK